MNCQTKKTGGYVLSRGCYLQQGGTHTQDKIYLMATQKQHKTFKAASCIHVLQAVKLSYILIFPGPEKNLHIPITDTAQIQVYLPIDPRLPRQTVQYPEEEMQEEELGPGLVSLSENNKKKYSDKFYSMSRAHIPIFL